jgi:hypothetical protein
MTAATWRGPFRFRSRTFHAVRTVPFHPDGLTIGPVGPGRLGGGLAEALVMHHEDNERT